jgi:hypothetical protein
MRHALGASERSLLVALTVVAMAAQSAAAATLHAVISFPTTPAVPVGSIDVTMSYDMSVLTPIPPPNPMNPTEVRVDALGAGAGALWLGNETAPGQIEVGGISAGGISQSGDLAQLYFDLPQPGMPLPQVTLDMFTLTDVNTNKLDAPAPVITVSIPEPSPESLFGAVLGALVWLGRASRLPSRRLV